MVRSLTVGFLLDRRWHWLRERMERSKEPDLSLLAGILGERRVPYAVIGGVALQVHHEEPRTTLDIEVALLRRNDLPRDALLASGFHETGRHVHSDNWTGPDGTPVQFFDASALADAVRRAVVLEIGGLSLRVIGIRDLLHEKLRSGRDPAPRRSKRLQDLADAHALIEQDPSLAAELDADERALLDGLPG